MKRMPRLPFCKHRFTVTGLNLERFINTMRKEGIVLLSARRADRRTLVCQCHSADLPRVCALVEEKGWRMRDIRPLGLSAVWAGLRRRPGIPVGLCLLMALALTLSQFVWRVEIHNAGPYQAELSACLRELGCAPGMPRSRVDAKRLESELTYRYPKIAWFHVYASGVSLVVEVTQGVAPPEPEPTDSANVYAARGGVVDSVRVFAGTAAVKAGDIVQKGQLLIEGTERGSDGETVPVHASGVVMARCWQSHTVTMPLLEVLSQESGRETCQTRVWTPWYAYPAQVEAPAYLAYNLYQTQLPVVGCFFPVVFEKRVFREVQMEYEPADAQTVRAQAEEAAFEQLKKQLYGYEIIDKWAESCMIEENTLAVTATAEWLMDIGGLASP